MNYSTGEQNIITPEFQMIQLSEGYCPHKCAWCYEHKIAIPKQDYPLPEIVRRDVRLTDMNNNIQYHIRFHSTKGKLKVIQENGW